ncbi:MAG: MATE family efflux transporter [Cyanobacteria bacterium P01_D01_bin.123]
MSLYASFLVIDIYFISALGVESLAGVSLVFPFLILLFSTVGGGIGISSSKLVSQRIGSKQYRDLSEIAFATIFLSLLISGIYIIGYLLFFDRFLESIDISIDSRIAASDFAVPVFLGSPIAAMSIAISGLLRSEKDLLTPVQMLFAGGVVNVILDPLLIFGCGFVPGLGVAGAGLATIIGFIISSLIGFRKISSRRSHFHVDLLEFRITFKLCMKIIRSAIPIVLTILTNNVVALCITVMLAKLGTQEVAAYGLLTRLEYVITIAMTGIGSSAVALGGIELGAGRMSGFADVTKKCGLLATSLVVWIAIALFHSPHLWFDLFSSDVWVREFGHQYLSVVSLTYPFFALGLVYSYAYQALDLGYLSLGLALVRGLFVALPGTIAVVYLNFPLVLMPIAIATSFATHGLISCFMFQSWVNQVRGELVRSPASL